MTLVLPRKITCKPLVLKVEDKHNYLVTAENLPEDDVSFGWHKGNIRVGYFRAVSSDNTITGDNVRHLLYSRVRTLNKVPLEIVTLSFPGLEKGVIVRVNNDRSERLTRLQAQNIYRSGIYDASRKHSNRVSRAGSPEILSLEEIKEFYEWLFNYVPSERIYK